MKRFLLGLVLSIGLMEAQSNNANYGPVYSYVGTALQAKCNNADLFYNNLTYLTYRCGPNDTWNLLGSSGAVLPATTNLIRGDGAGGAANSGISANSAGIIGLFTGCSGVQYLGADGACHASGGSGTVPFALSFTSSVITIGVSNPSGTNGVDIGTVLSVNAASTFTPSGGGTGTAFIYLSGGTGGTTSGTVTVNHNITGACAGCTAQAGTNYDVNSKPIGVCSITAGAVTACTQTITPYSIQPYVFSSGLSASVSNGLTTVVAVPAVYPFTALTDGATVTWDTLSAQNANATLLFTVHTGSRTLNLSNLINGGNYVIRLTQDGTGGTSLAGGTGCTWKQPGGGGSTFTLTASAAAIDVIAFTYDGTNCLSILTKAYN